MPKHLILHQLLGDQSLRSDHGTCMLGMEGVRRFGAARGVSVAPALTSENDIAIGKLICWLALGAVVG